MRGEIIETTATDTIEADPWYRGFGARAAAVLGTSASLVAAGGVAFAEDPVPVDVAGTISTALTDVTSNIGPVAAVGLGVGGTILAFTIGWRLLKRFAK